MEFKFSKELFWLEKNILSIFLYIFNVIFRGYAFIYIFEFRKKDRFVSAARRACAVACGQISGVLRYDDDDDDDDDVSELHNLDRKMHTHSDIYASCAFVCVIVILFLSEKSMFSINKFILYEYGLMYEILKFTSKKAFLFQIMIRYSVSLTSKDVTESSDEKYTWHETLSRLLIFNLKRNAYGYLMLKN